MAPGKSNYVTVYIST